MKTSLLGVAMLGLAAASPQATIVLQDDFSGSYLMDLNGQPADVGGNWSANDFVAADGTFQSLGSEGSAMLAVSLETSSVYTLSMDLYNPTDRWVALGLGRTALAFPGSSAGNDRYAQNGRGSGWMLYRNNGGVDAIEFFAGPDTGTPLSGENFGSVDFSKTNTLSIVYVTAADGNSYTVDYFVNGGSICSSGPQTVYTPISEIQYAGFSYDNTAAGTIFVDHFQLEYEPAVSTILSPYEDGSALHIWHLDESAGATLFSDSGYGASLNLFTIGGLTAGATTFTNFGSAVDVPGISDGLNGGEDVSTTSVLGVDHADIGFTIEALVNFNSVSGGDRHIVSLENDGDPSTRPFQFKLSDNGTILRFQGIASGGQHDVSMPPSGDPNEFFAGKWYHVAVTYNGSENTADNLKFYWTPLDTVAGEAVLLGTSMMTGDIGSATGDLAIGNEVRATGGSSNGLVGRIDEVVISEGAKRASEFMFVPGNDVDGDGLSDIWEQQVIDADGSDAIETIYDVLPGDDYDEDALTNEEEYHLGTNPTVANGPNDLDGDGLNDDWEMAHFGSLSYDGGDDPDGDSFNNGAEAEAGTDPNNDQNYPGHVDKTTPSGLMLDLLAHPHRTTIPDTAPEFTWIFAPATRGESQRAYQIIVASSDSLARAGSGDVWDSGQVVSSDSVDVEYAGAALVRGSSYFWRVRTWGEGDAPSSWSPMQFFTIESSSPQSGSRSIYKASATDASGYNWAGHYQSSFDTVVAPVSVVDKGGGTYFIDFGKDAFGYLSFRLDGSFSGQTVTVRMGEAANGNSVDRSPDGTIRYGAVNVDLSNGNQTYEARYATTVTGLYGGGINVTDWAGAIMPFRYAELINCPATITAADIRQHVLHVPFDDDAAHFTSSDPTLNEIFAFCKYSMKATSFTGVYVDGDRERKPYEADAYINQLSHYGVDREYTVARYSYEYMLDHSTWPTEWKLHFPLMAWADYMYTGNKEALAANYSAILGQVDQYSIHERGDGLLSYGSSDNIVDWPRGERDGYEFTSLNNVVNAFYYKSWRILADIATELGYLGDAVAYTAQADQMEASFNSVFWNGSEYQDGESSSHVSAHANLFPMALGLVPSNRVASVMDFLKTSRSINGRTEYMPCSVYGAQYLLEALFEGGEADRAIFLMADSSTSRTRHWYNMIREGSTISTEAWGLEFKPNQDWNHAWGAVPGNIIPRYVLGLKPITAGFGQVEIKPQLGTGDGTNGLTQVSGTIPTIRGPVLVEAKNSLTSFHLQIDIPGNMTATVSIPTKGFADPVVLYDGVVVHAPVVDGRLVIEHVPAGKHSFWLSDTPNPDAATLKANWKAAMFGNDLSNADDALDPDGDGWTTGDEFYANTDPLDIADSWGCAMQLTMPNGPLESLQNGKGGRRYVLERTPSLMPTSWSMVDQTNLSVDATVILIDTNQITSNAFYRTQVGLP